MSGASFKVGNEGVISKHAAPQKFTKVTSLINTPLYLSEGPSHVLHCLYMLCVAMDAGPEL